jgi:hypothetical protein
MKIKYYYTEKVTIQEFAEKHDLTMIVAERKEKTPTRFYAGFEDCDIVERNLLISVHGNGDTENEAIRDYVRQISGKIIMYNRWDERANRKEIIVPTLLDYTPDE